MTSTMLAAHVATQNVQAIISMAIFGLGGASSTVIGTLIGAGKLAILRATAILLPVMSVAIWGVVGTGLQLGRSSLAKMYCKEEEVQRIVEHLLIMSCVNGFLIASQCTAG